MSQYSSVGIGRVHYLVFTEFPMGTCKSVDQFFILLSNSLMPFIFECLYQIWWKSGFFSFSFHFQTTCKGNHFLPYLFFDDVIWIFLVFTCFQFQWNYQIKWIKPWISVLVCIFRLFRCSTIENGKFEVQSKGFIEFNQVLRFEKLDQRHLWYFLIVIIKRIVLWCGFLSAIVDNHRNLKDDQENSPPHQHRKPQWF